MPKIIENVRCSILAAARKQLLENGYSNMTMRSVAAASNIAVGTLYNYFESKEVLTAHFVLEDWLKMLDGMKARCSKVASAQEMLSCMHKTLVKFGNEYSPLFEDKSAKKGYANSVLQYRKQLLGQLADVIRINCERMGLSVSPILPDFVADALVTWSYSGCDYEEVERLLLKLF